MNILFYSISAFHSVALKIWNKLFKELCHATFQASYKVDLKTAFSFPLFLISAFLWSSNSTPRISLQ